MPIRTLFVLAALPLCASSAQAALLVYEPFAYTSGVALNTLTPNASTQGLSTTLAYGGSGSESYTVQSSSLSFAGLRTDGGSVSFTSGTRVGAARLDLAANYSGTLYNSYLVTMSARGGVDTDGIGLRVANDNTSGGDRFSAYADARDLTNNREVGVNYGSGTSGVTHSGVNLALDTPYLIIARFTNVGIVLSPSTQGVASIFAMTEAQFANFKASGGDDAYLDNATVSGAASGITARAVDGALESGTFSFNTGNFFAMVGVSGVGSFDEVRYGSTLADVTPVPEPASALLAALGSLGMLAMRRSRR